jgi:hypothetical protein
MGLIPCLLKTLGPHVFLLAMTCHLSILHRRVYFRHLNRVQSIYIYIYIYVVRKGHIFGMLAHVAGNFSDFFVYIPGRIIKGRPPRGILGHDGKCVRICLGLSNSLFGRILAKRYAAALLVPLSVHVLPCSLPTSRNSFAAYCPACLFLSVRLGETNCTSHSNIASHNTAANSEVFLLFAERGEISSHHDRTLQMCP